jgi:hypothetical protein
MQLTLREELDRLLPVVDLLISQVQLQQQQQQQRRNASSVGELLRASLLAGIA